MSTGRIVLLVVIGLAAVLTIVIVIARRRALRREAQRRQDLATQGVAVGLTFVGDDPALLGSLGNPPILSTSHPKVFNVLRGMRRGHAVTVFDYTWLVDSTERPRWNIEPSSGEVSMIRTCVLAVTVIELRVALPAFLLQPNEMAPFRANADRAAAALGDQSGMLGAIVKAAESLAHSIPDQPGLQFPARPGFHDQYLVTGEDEARVRKLFDEKLLDALASKPGWIVNAAGGRLFVSVLLSRWPPTHTDRTRLGNIRLLAPEHLPALVDGALDLAELLESRAR